MFLFAKQCPDVVIEKALKRALLHSVLLGYLYSLGGCKGWRKQIDYCLLLAVERIFIEDILNVQCRLFEILRQFNGPLHGQQVDTRLVTLSASPSCQLDNQAEADDVYLQLAIDTYDGIICFPVYRQRKVSPLLLRGVCVSATRKYR